MNNITKIFYCTLAILLLFSCVKKQETETETDNFIEISDKQFTGEGMQLGKIEPKLFETRVACTGTIVSKPNGMARINVPLAGTIKSIRCNDGQIVGKNQILFEVSGAEVLDIQKDYAEAAVVYKRAKSEYERQNLLFVEKVISEKEFIMFESEYKTSMAKYTNLELKINALGLSGQQIERGEFSTSYSIKSPIKGNISNLKASIGTYVDQQFALAEVTDPAQFQVQLSLFASDIAHIKRGQTVRFRFASSQTEMTAIISSVGISVNNDTKSIDCKADLKNINSLQLVANAPIQAEIVTGLDSVQAIPQEAVISSDTEKYALVLDKKKNNSYYFTKTQLNIGRQQNAYIEIISPKLNASLLVKGVYNIAL
jgi:cobalt-zinc-cadmium efflux system membrane fusion protein